MKRIVLIALLLLMPAISHAFMGGSMLRAQCQPTGGGFSYDTSKTANASDCSSSGSYANTPNFTSTAAGNIGATWATSGDVSSTEIALYTSTGTLKASYTGGTSPYIFGSFPAGTYYIQVSVTNNYDCASIGCSASGYIH